MCVTVYSNNINVTTYSNIIKNQELTKMKKIFTTLLLSALTITSIFSSGTKEGALEKTKMNEPIQVGISKMVSHPALDAIEQGIQDSINQFCLIGDTIS